VDAWFDPRFFGTVFVTLFVIMDPPGVVPVFLGLTAGRTQSERRRMATVAVTTAFLVITVFAVAGETILRYLGISLPSLQAAGGLLLLVVALQLLTGQHDVQPSGNLEANIAMVPLGTPLLAGPGAIVATILFARAAEDRADIVALAAGIVAISLVLWLVMRYSVLIIKVIRESGVVLMSRIAGLLLSAIAVQLIADAIFQFIDQGGAG
jgi:multiple antibiotic resistance protein